jgi:hypothetical protein
MLYVGAWFCPTDRFSGMNRQMVAAATPPYQISFSANCNCRLSMAVLMTVPKLP